VRKLLRPEGQRYVAQVSGQLLLPGEAAMRSQHFLYMGADKSLARSTSRCILFDGENVSFDASLTYIYIVLKFLQLWL